MVRLLADDLHEHRTGDVVAGLGAEDDEFLLILHHGGKVRQRDISAGPGVVETAVVVLLDGDRVVRLGHGARRSVRGRGARTETTAKLRIFIVARQGFVRHGRALVGRSLAFLRLKPYLCSIEMGVGNLYRGADHPKDSGGLARGGLDDANLAARSFPAMTEEQ
jgi:hypothetical protein